MLGSIERGFCMRVSQSVGLGGVGGGERIQSLVESADSEADKRVPCR